MNANVSYDSGMFTNPIENDDRYTSCIAHGRTFITCDIAAIILVKEILFVGCHIMLSLVRGAICPEIEDISKEIHRSQGQKVEDTIHSVHIGKVVMEQIFIPIRLRTHILAS